MKQRTAIKLDRKVICKLADSGTHTLVFDTSEEAADFVKFVDSLDPNKPEDVQLFEDTIQAISAPENSEEAKRQREIEEKNKQIEALLTKDERFTRSQGCLYFSETKNLSIPEVLADALVESVNDPKRFEALLNFWRLNALNPDPEAREGLYRFITDLDLSLTSEGMFVAYRNVTNRNEIDHKVLDKINRLWMTANRNMLDTNTQLVQIVTIYYPVDNDDYDDYDDYDDGEWPSYDSETFFVISTEEIKIPEEKTKLSKILPKDARKQIAEEANSSDACPKWKKLRKIGKITNVTFLGNLQEVYIDMVQSVGKGLDLTDAHTRTMNINVGVPVSIKRSECDPDPNVSCSRGLHVGSVNFMSRGYFGSLGLIVLVNPKDVVAVPYEYGTGYKMRCCKYLPIAIASYDENDALIPVKSKVLNINSSEFLKEELEMMKTLANQNYEDAVKHQYLPSHMSYIDTQALINSIRDQVVNRTVKV